MKTRNKALSIEKQTKQNHCVENTDFPHKYIQALYHQLTLRF